MIHHTEQHQGVNYHLLHRQLRHRDTPRPPGPAPCDPQTPAIAATLADPPGPAPPLPARPPPRSPFSAPRVPRAPPRIFAPAAILRRGKAGARWGPAWVTRYEFPWSSKLKGQWRLIKVDLLVLGPHRYLQRLFALVLSQFTASPPHPV